MTARTPSAPHGVSATGVQRAIGERRRRRDRERGGEIDLDATMSSWPEPDPPTRARPVVRPRRALPGAATAPGLPTPHAMLVREHSESPPPRPATGSTAVRRTRRPGAAVAGAAAGAAVAAGVGVAGAAATAGSVAGAGARRTAGAVSAAGASLAGAATGLLGPPGRAGAGPGEAPLRTRRTGAEAVPGHRPGPEPLTQRLRSVPGEPQVRERSVAGDPTLRVVTRSPAPAESEPGEAPAGVAPAPAADPFQALGSRSSSGGPAAPAVPQGRRRRDRPPGHDDADGLRPDPAPVGDDTDGLRRQYPAPAGDDTASFRRRDRAPGDDDTGSFRRRDRAPAGGDTGSFRRRPPVTTAPAVPEPPAAPARRSFEGFPDALRNLRPPAGSTRARPVSALDEPRRRLPVSAPILGVGAAALAVLLLVLVLVFRPGGEATPSAALVPPDSPRQDTVLVNLLDEDATVLRGLLMAVGPVDGTEQVVPVIVPGDMTVAVPDAGSLPLAQAPSVGPEAPDRAVEDLLGVRVDGTWVLDRGLLADLVDTAGGVEVDVATAVTAGDVTVPVGPAQRLTGAQAVAYATASVEGEDPGVALARFAQVVVGLVAAMPEEAGEVTRVLSQVDRHPDTTATSEQLSSVLAEASQVLAAQEDPAPFTVPTADGGEGPPTPDADAVAALVDERLQGARLPVSTVGPLRVVVGNAVGEPGLVTAARDRLVAAGFRFVGGGTVEGEPAPATTVLVPSDTPENRERGQAVAAALGIPPDALFVKADFEADVPEGTDIIVWLGQDYADTLGGEE